MSGPRTDWPLSDKELALYRAGLSTAPTMTTDPMSMVDAIRLEWTDRCRQLLATLDEAEGRVVQAGDEAVAAERLRVKQLMDRGSATVDAFCLPLDVAREIMEDGP